MKNIIMFMVDQLSAKWLEIAIKDEVCPLPNIKNLMENGTYFSKAISNNPVCCPARATIATGLTDRKHAVIENFIELDTSLDTFMKQLQKNNYTTGAFGKLHFISHSVTLHPQNEVYGFDVTHITEDDRGGEWLDWIIEEHPEYLDDVLATIWNSSNEEFKCYGKDKLNLTDRIAKIRKSYDWKTENCPLNTQASYTHKFPKELSQTEWITSKALDFLSDESIKSPIFTQISYVQPHGPRNLPEEYLQYVDESKLPIPAETEWLTDENTPNYYKEIKENTKNNKMYDRKCYFADLVHLDEQLGKVVQKLKDTNRFKESVIVFLADHGDLLGDHGAYGKGNKHYDACIRIPLIISGAGLGKRKIHDGFVQHEDICPTMLELGECESDREFYGKSLVGICKGTDTTSRNYAYTESYSGARASGYANWCKTILDHQFRYTYYADFSGEQLFDLKNDVNEQTNLAKDEKYAEIKQNLKNVLLEYIVKQDNSK
ncbi:MAG: sulfatase-like hydrolase/transferase [Clostridia bacterium]